MAAKRKSSDTTGFLLEAWRPPDDAGDAVACLATTFTFDAAVFEEECLARFLGLEGSPEESGPAYLIEREEKLSAVTAAVMVDAQHARGSRHLRWDMLAARLPRVGGAQPILHAKVWLLMWSKAMRLVVSSANLTRQGLRVNHEMFGVLGYSKESPGPRAPLTGMLDFLGQASEWAVNGPARQRWLEVLRLAESFVDKWTTNQAPGGVSIHALSTGPGKDSLVDQLGDRLPQGAPDYAEVLSPFFDSPSSTNKPAEELWKRMARDASAPKVSFCLARDNALSEPGKPAFRAPASLLRLPAGRNPGNETRGKPSAACEKFVVGTERSVGGIPHRLQQLHHARLRVRSDEKRRGCAGLCDQNPSGRLGTLFVAA
jgi:hypothetical protein